MASYYTPNPQLRERSVERGKTAVLFIDVQNYNCNHKGAIHSHSTPEELQAAQYFFQHVDDITPAWVSLQQLCRDAHVEVMYTVIQSLTRDGRDRGLDYKISGFHVAPGSWDAQVIEALQPVGLDELVLPKTTSSVFSSTNIDFLLRSMGIQYLILCGCLTDQCVAHAVMDACDLNYYVTLVPECCATYSQERHDACLSAIKGYCRMRTLEQLEEELAGVEAIADPSPS